MMGFYQNDKIHQDTEPRRVNTKTTTTTHFIDELLKTKDKENAFKLALYNKDINSMKQNDSVSHQK
jgi:hypothetical protein